MLISILSKAVGLKYNCLLCVHRKQWYSLRAFCSSTGFRLQSNISVFTLFR